MILKVRQQQLSVFAEDQRRRFVTALCEHAREQFPEDCAMLGDDALHARVQQSIRRAQAYGIRERVDICQYLNYMFIFGEDFDKELPWAGKILGNPLESSGAVKMLSLNAAALEDAE